MAILAADVAGYSRLMGADEEGTLVDLQTFRKTLVDPKFVERRRLIVIRSSVGAGHSRNNVLVAWVMGARALWRCAAPVGKLKLGATGDFGYCSIHQTQRHTRFEKRPYGGGT
jgi:class 3 adenylate cyclase